MRSTAVVDAQALTVFAAQLMERLERTYWRLSSSIDPGSSDPALEPAAPFVAEESGEECAWLAAARRRIERQLDRCAAALERALPLPEFRAQRAARTETLLQHWVDALQDIDAGLARELGAAHPVLEMLFPHRNYEKLRRGGAQANAYRIEFERRRGSAYIRRIASEPEYASLAPLLQRADAAYVPIKAMLDAPPPDEALSESLRAEIAQEAAALDLTLRQARHLADAVGVTYPALMPELALEMKRRRTKPESKSELDQQLPE